MTGQVDVEPLQWSVPPHPREPAIGYASRLAALAGDDLATLMRGTGVNVFKLYVGDGAAVTAVAALGGLDPARADAMARVTPRRIGPSDSRVGDEGLSWRSLLVGHVRYCPHCIAGDLRDGPEDVPPTARTWLRTEWMIDQFRSCPLHAVRLFETDHVTARTPIVDFSATVEADVLPRLERLRSEAVPAEDGAFEEWLVRRLNGDRDPNARLDRMPLYAAVDVCEAFGVETLGAGMPRWGLLDPSAKAAACLAGFRIAQGTPAGIERFLDGLVARGHEVRLVGARPIYGQIWNAFERTVDDPAFGELREIVRRHMLENVPFQAGCMVLGQVLERRRLHTMTSAARESRVNHQTLRGMFARPGMTMAGATPGGERLTVRVDEFEDQLREFGTGMTIDEVKASTGILHRHVLELIAHGVIPALFGSREVARARHRLKSNDVKGFMDRLFEGAVIVERPTRNQMKLGRACLAASTNVVELVNLILAGRLSWKGRLRAGVRYTDLLVDAGEVLAVLQGGKPPQRNMTKVEVTAEMKGMRYQFVVRMIAAGHLTVVREFCPKVRRHLRLITRESFEAFRDRFVTLTELGHAKDVHWRIVRRHLTSAGCQPAYVWDARGSAIYERTEDLDAALARLPVGAAAGASQCIETGVAA